jgi:hypothetical protein
MENKMEAKGQDTIKTRSETYFFEWIEARMVQQGFEVLETTNTDKNRATHSKEMLGLRSIRLPY